MVFDSAVSLFADPDIQRHHLAKRQQAPGGESASRAGALQARRQVRRQRRSGAGDSVTRGKPVSHTGFKGNSVFLSTVLNFSVILINVTDDVNVLPFTVYKAKCRDTHTKKTTIFYYYYYLFIFSSLKGRKMAESQRAAGFNADYRCLFSLSS